MKEHLQLDPTKLLEHMENTFENPTPAVERFLQGLRDNPNGVVKVKVTEEDRFLTSEECLICHSSRKVFGADCPYCTEGV